MRLLCGIKPSRIHLGHILSVFSFLQSSDYLKLNVVQDDVYILIGDLHKLSTAVQEDGEHKHISSIINIVNYLSLKYYVQSELDIEYYKTYIILTAFSNMKHVYKIYNINYFNDTQNNCMKFNYPILMLTDIVLMQPCIVLVAKDQIHNVRFIKHVLKRMELDQCVKFCILDDKIQNFVDGETKMSTSIDHGSIFLDDLHDKIKAVVMKAKTQSIVPQNISEVEKSTMNLYYVYSKIHNINVSDVVQLFRTYDCFYFKNKLYCSIVALFDKFKTCDKQQDFNAINLVRAIHKQNYLNYFHRWLAFTR